MKIRCLECDKIHMTEGWIPLDQSIDETRTCEIHITCSCLNKMTVEHSHTKEICYRETKDVTLTLGCEILTGAGVEVNHYHNFDDVLDQYFTKSVYDKWTTPQDTKKFYYSLD